MTDGSRRILMLGLASHGKTTFLAALWHVLNTADVPTAMTLRRFVGDRSYANQIMRAWQSCQPVPHTPVGADDSVVICLAGDLGQVDVTIPDLSGERLRLYLANRAWPRSFDLLVQSAEGVLLFVHPEQIDEGESIENALEWAAAASTSPPLDNDPPYGPVGFDRGRLPTQVSLVDLLQLVADRLGTLCVLPVAVVVSAWDRVASGQRPDEYLESRLPLLHDALAFNRRFAHYTFGVSAQGGRLPEDASRLAKEPRPSNRIVVVADGTTSHDITDPIRWLLAHRST